jgi:hypothetical protein
MSSPSSGQAEALTNVLRYHACRSSHPEDRKLPITELKWNARTLADIPGNRAHWFFAFFWRCTTIMAQFSSTSVSRIAWHTCIISQNVCTCLCFINIYSKTVYTPWNSYQAEALTNVLRYHTCRSSHPEDRKLPITELKWDARTLTDIPGNTAYITIP